MIFKGQYLVCYVIDMHSGLVQEVTNQVMMILLCCQDQRSHAPLLMSI